MNSRSGLASILVALGLIAVCGVGVGVYYAVQEYLRLTEQLPDAKSLLTYSPRQPSIILSADGEKIGEIFDEKRYPLAFKDINPTLVKCFLAAEDARFFEHSGVDWQGITRAGLLYVTNSGVKQGGSTITQQLAKMLLLTRDRTFERKLKDILLARQIEQILTKEQILELYLNTIFLGNQSYGVEAAAQNYFRKPSSQLDLAEAALIAGLAPAPSAFAPTVNFKKAKTRQKFVLEQMAKNGWIAKKVASEAFKKKLHVYQATSPNTKVAPYFFMEVQKELQDKLKLKNLGSAGYTIKTTLNLKLQKKAEAAMLAHLKQFEQNKGFKGPVAHHRAENLAKAVKEFTKRAATEEREVLHAIVLDLLPRQDAVLVLTSEGLGYLLAEDHGWALGKVTKDSAVTDFANILKIGDEIRVQKIANKKPRDSLRSRGFSKEISDLIALVKGGELPAATNPAEFDVTSMSETMADQGMGPGDEDLQLPSEGKLADGVDKGGLLSVYRLTDVEGVEAAGLVMDAQTGNVLVMLGGASFAANEFNHATQARRQVGSAVKPLYYAFAMDNGFSPLSQIDSPPIVIGDWKPENYTREFSGRTTLHNSLVKSFNVASIQLFTALGSQKISEWFTRFGFGWPKGDLSLALGSGNATLLQMVQAYSMFANEGRLRNPRYITGVSDRNGKRLFSEDEDKFKILEEKETHVVSAAAAYVTVRIMQDVIRFGTGTRAAGILGAAGKTGTTNGYTDAWFLGVTPGLVGGVWIGFDDARKSLGPNGTGGQMAAPLWKLIMQEVYETQKKSVWSEPGGINKIRANLATGQISFGREGAIVPVVSGTEPGAFGARNALGLQSFNEGFGTDNGSRSISDPTTGTEGVMPATDSIDLRSLQ